MLLQVHDELVLEVPVAELDAVRTLVREAMEGVWTLKVPLRVDVHDGANWSAGALTAGQHAAVRAESEHAMTRQTDQHAVTLTDGELVERARRGDREAFRGLVERYQRKVAALALGMLSNREDALDVVQDTFTKAYQSLDKFKGDSSFYTWVYRIGGEPLHRPPAARVALRPGRRRSWTIPVTRSYRRSAEDLERGRAVRDARAARRSVRTSCKRSSELTPEHRAVILLREVDGLSYEEISQVLDVPEGHRDEPPPLRAPPTAGAAAGPPLTAHDDDVRRRCCAHRWLRRRRADARRLAIDVAPSSRTVSALRCLRPASARDARGAGRRRRRAPSTSSISRASGPGVDRAIAKCRGQAGVARSRRGQARRACSRRRRVGRGGGHRGRHGAVPAPGRLDPTAIARAAETRRARRERADREQKRLPEPRAHRSARRQGHQRSAASRRAARR